MAAIINGKRFDVPPGASISVVGNKVYIDGVLQKTPENKESKSLILTIQGDLGGDLKIDNINCEDFKLQIEGDVKGSIDATSVEVQGSVHKSINATNVHVGTDVGGSIDASNVEVGGDVGGSIDASNVEVGGDVHGDIKALNVS